MIISFSGRKGCGKSTAANVLISRGYIKISFADYLKKIVSELFNWKLIDLYDINKKEEQIEPVLWDKDAAKKLSKIANIDDDIFYESMSFSSRRRALQYIGTEVLRRYDSDFHVKKLLSNLDPSINYVMDDCRFPNELNFLKKNNAICIYIIRPNLFDYSNHISEISLSRHDFQHVLLSIKDEKYLIKKVTGFIEALTKNKGVGLQYGELEKLLKRYNTREIAKRKKCSVDKVIWWASKFLLPVNRHKYEVNHNAFSKPTTLASYYAGLISADGCIKQSGKSKTNMLLELCSTDKILCDGFNKWIGSTKPLYIKKRPGKKTIYSSIISSNYIIEDIKLWNLEPRKSRLNKIPDIIKNDLDMLKYWIVGLIDGDGSICISKKRLIITILASKEIIIFIKNLFSNINCSMRQEKDIDNLFNLRFSGTYAVKFYKEIYCGVGLSRKWDKVLNFIK